MTNKIKYPSTRYLPCTKHRDPNDKMMSEKEYDLLLSEETVVLEKLDGENCSLYSDFIHTRSIQGMTRHPSRSHIKQLWGNIKHMIPEGIRICGENVYAKHSIYYEDLPSYFMVFSVWKDYYSYPWEAVEALCDDLGLITVPVLSGPKIHTRKDIDAIIASLDTSKQEGIVIRTAHGFMYNDFDVAVGKWVRENHVTTNEHWLNQPVVPNKLKI